MTDDWGLFLFSEADSDCVLCRITGHYLNYERTITASKPDEHLQYKDSIPLGTIKQADVFHFREILLRLDVNNRASFSSSHDFVRKALERMEHDGILDTGSQTFQKALKWIKQNYDDAGD